MYALRDVDLFNVLCLPDAALLDDNDLTAVYTEAIALCEAERAVILVDVPPGVDAVQEMVDWLDARGLRHRNAAVYFPRLRPRPACAGRLRNFAPAARWRRLARTDAARGVWKAPAGTRSHAAAGSQELDDPLTDAENGGLNPLGINCLRAFPVDGHVVWGARTLRRRRRAWPRSGSTCPSDALALFLEESLYRGTQWVVFEPNDEPLWAQIRLNVGAFMHNLFRQGAFQGTTPREAYFVKCDSETTTQDDIDLGIVNICVGFAPAEAGRVRDHPDPADGRPDRQTLKEETAMAQFTRERPALRPVQELQVPGQVGRPVRGRREQGRRPQAHHRGGRAPRGRRPSHQPEVARAAPSTRPSRWSGA